MTDEAKKAEQQPEAKPAVTKEVAKQAVVSVKKSISKVVRRPAKKANKPVAQKESRKRVRTSSPKRTRKTKPGRRPGRRRTPAAKRERVVRKFREFVDAGASRQEAAKKVRFYDLTIRRWEEAMGLKPASSRGSGKSKAKRAGAGKKVKKVVKGKRGRKPGRPKGNAAGKKRGRPRGRSKAKAVGRPRGRPRKVREVAVHPVGGLVLVSPTGHRVEGITVIELLRVLKALK